MNLKLFAVSATRNQDAESHLGVNIKVTTCLIITIIAARDSKEAADIFRNTIKDESWVFQITPLSGEYVGKPDILYSHTTNFEHSSYINNPADEVKTEDIPSVVKALIALPRIYAPCKSYSRAVKIQFVCNHPHWLVICGNSCLIYEGDIHSSANLTLTVDEHHLESMLVGDTSMTECLLTGKIIVSGELSILDYFQRWFDPVKLRKELDSLASTV